MQRTFFFLQMLQEGKACLSLAGACHTGRITHAITVSVGRPARLLFIGWPILSTAGRRLSG